MSGFTYEWPRVYGGHSVESMDDSSYSPNSTSASLNEVPLTSDSSYLEGFQETAAAYSIPSWGQNHVHSHFHNHAYMHNFSYSSREGLTNANIAQSQTEWNDYPHLHNYRVYGSTPVTPHDAMSTCSHDSIKTSPEIESSTQTDLHPPPTETHESSPENATALHHWIQLSPVTTSKSIKQCIVDASTPERRLFFCAWDGCNHLLGFPNKSQLMTHVRSLHLQEKPFLCTTCRTLFARKQDAIRHVNTANSGKRYECGLCGKSFARKSYRDSHQNLCNERRALLASAISSRSRT